jgi:glyoxylase-like metal-dependent hydrolase (beta-lactamase superfamily II)
MLLVGAAGHIGMADDAMRSAEMFKIERVSRHVYAAIAQTNPVVNGNSAIIVTEKGLVVVDSQSYPFAAHSLYSQFTREVKDLPVRYLINTHHHLDHAHGNAAYAKMFGSQLDIISTDFSRAALEQAGRWFSAFLDGRPEAPAQIQAVSRQEMYYAFLQGYIGSLRDEIPAIDTRLAGLNGEKRAAELNRANALRTYFSEMSGFVPVLPNLTFNYDLRLHCGDVTIELLFLGRGHTAGDVVVFVPEDRVVVTGDLVHGLDPLLMEAYPDEWPITVGKVAELDFDSLVPGHGPVQHGRAMLTLFKDYLTELNQLVKEGVTDGKNLVTLQSEVAPERLHSLSNQSFGRMMQRNREELLGLSPGQPLSPVVRSEVEQIYNYYVRK